MGHADAGFTLRTYTHRMSENDDSARKAVDAALTVPSAMDAPSAPCDACSRRSAAYFRKHYDI